MGQRISTRSQRVVCMGHGLGSLMSWASVIELACFGCYVCLCLCLPVVVWASVSLLALPGDMLLC